MKKIIFLAALIASPLLHSQATVQWELNSPGASNYENHTVATDSQGNVYSTGTYTTSYDFDPGPGVSTMTCFQTNMFILKLDAAGNFVWAKQIGGGTSTSYSQGNAITVDALDNVYIAGTATGFFGPIDFDPGTGVHNLTTPLGEADIFILKLDSAGNFAWVDQIRNPTDTLYGLDSAQSLKADASGNVYITGGFGGTADFDPGAGTYNLTSNGGSLSTNAFILKLDNSGSFVWAKSMANTATATSSTVVDKGYGIDVDSAGNVYTVGYFWGTIDADPGAGSHPLTAYTSDNPVESGSNELFVSKLDAAGNFVWAYNMIGDHNLNFHPSLVVASDTIILAGYANSNLSDVADVDFGPGTFYLPVGTGSFVLKMDTSANLIWAKSTAQAAGNQTSSWGKGLAVDASGNVYTAGDFYVSAHDFDPGSGTDNLTPSSVDIYVSKLDASGNFVWANQIGGTGVDNGYSIAVSPAGKVIVSGTAGTGGFSKSVASVNQGSFLASLQQPNLGIAESLKQDMMVIYPNPSHGTFTINVDDAVLGADVSVFNLIGQEISHFKISETTTQMTLPSGVYLVNANSNGHQIIKKLIVE